MADAAASATQQLQIANMYASIFSRLQQQQQQQQQHFGASEVVSPKQASVYPDAVPRLLRQLTVDNKTDQDEDEEGDEDDDDDDRHRRRHHHHQMPFDLSSRRPLSPARGKRCLTI